MSLPLVWLGLCIFMAWTIEAMSGFGSIVIALSLGALLLPMDFMLPILVTLNVLSSSWMVWQHRRNIDFRVLLRIVLPAMLLGTGLGVLLQGLAPDTILKTAFAVFVLGFALRELWILQRSGVRSSHPPLQTQLIVVAAGVTHGLFASGGPLLVHALAGRQMDKAAFRATMIAVWLTLNLALAATFLLQGRLLPQLPLIAGFMPVIVLAIVVGSRLHHRLDEAKFRVMVYWLLAAVGVALLLSQLRTVWG
ncbi:MAG: sulfite exporter TauE/SafE family protein [Pedobacter sp.]|nr:sulfite exporter TauE/SafE family protein [Pedobacter sp.]